MMKNLCVFCASSPGLDPALRAAAREVGQEMVRQKLDLVYGGGNIGLMGELADSVLRAGGQVTGVIPSFLEDKEVAHSRLTELIVVSSMHERKTKMFELSEGFLALPGGFGTFEEIFEILTWSQLGLHSRPIAFLNVSGFYDLLIGQFKVMEKNGLIRAEHCRLPIFDAAISPLLARMKAWQPKSGEKWLGKRET